MTRSSDLVMVERGVLLHAISRFECLAEDFEAAGELVDWAMCQTDAQKLGRALQSVEGGVQGGSADGQQCNEHRPQALSRDSRLADDLERLCCAETEGQFFSYVADNIQTIIKNLRASEAMTFIRAMDIAEAGFAMWKAKPHNVKWFKHIDGTPIPNDLLVNIAEAFCNEA